MEIYSTYQNLIADVIRITIVIAESISISIPSFSSHRSPPRPLFRLLQPISHSYLSTGDTVWPLLSDSISVDMRFMQLHSLSMFLASGKT